MCNTYKFVLNCSGGPHDGDSFTFVNASEDYKRFMISGNTDGASVEEQFAQFAYAATRSGEVGKTFVVPSNFHNPNNDGRYTYRITEKLVDDDNRQIACTAELVQVEDKNERHKSG